MVKWIIGFGLVLVGAAPAGAEEVLPYRSPGWRYHQVAHEDPLGAVFMQPDFDDSAWSVGTGAFGSSGYCPVGANVNTLWSPGTDLLLRRTFDVDANALVLIHFAIDNVAKIYVNGTLVADVAHVDCANLDDYNVVVPKGVILPGTNQLSVHAIDGCCISFFDLRIESEGPTVLPFESPGWRYVQVEHDDPLGAVFMAPAFDDSNWSPGQAAFGSSGYCPSGASVHTPWSPGTDLLLRHPFFVNASAPVILEFGIDNVAHLYVNGTLVIDQAHVDCASRDDYQVVVSSHLLISGQNLLAVHAIDGCCISFFDLRIEGELPPVAVKPTTWSRLKSLYR